MLHLYYLTRKPFFTGTRLMRLDQAAHSILFHLHLVSKMHHFLMHKAAEFQHIPDEISV